MPHLTLSADVFRYWVIDHVAREIRIVRQDGQESRHPLGDPDPLWGSQVALSIFDWDRWWITSITLRDHVVIAEGYNPLQLDPLAGRPVVYLDQNHWSTLARAMLDPARVRKRSEIGPALELARLAQDARVVLPLSSAHLREAGALFADQRYELGVVMASLSGGWQMRHPMQVWRHEGLRMFANLFSTVLPAEPPVMTLEPYALLDTGVDAWMMDPSDPALFQMTLTAPSVTLEMLIDLAPAPSGPADSWVHHHQAVTNRVSAMGGPVSRRRAVALGEFWLEHLGAIEGNILELGWDASVLLAVAPKERRRLLRRSRMLSFVSELFTQRHVSRSTHWRSNDLTDLLFLGCAAGYANYVAAEAATGNQLRQRQESIGQPPTVFTDLTSLVKALARDGVK